MHSEVIAHRTRILELDVGPDEFPLSTQHATTAVPRGATTKTVDTALSLSCSGCGFYSTQVAHRPYYITHKLQVIISAA